MGPALPIPLVLTAIGTLCGGIGAVMLGAGIVFCHRAVHCPGTVVDLQRRSGRSPTDPGQRRWCPVLRFRTVENAEMRTRVPLGTSWRRYRTGQRVTVSYDPRRPAHAVADGGRGGVLAAAAFTGLGTLLVGVGLLACGC